MGIFVEDLDLTNLCVLPGKAGERKSCTRRKSEEQGGIGAMHGRGAEGAYRSKARGRDSEGRRNCRQVSSIRRPPFQKLLILPLRKTSWKIEVFTSITPHAIPYTDLRFRMISRFWIYVLIAGLWLLDFGMYPNVRSVDYR